MLTENQISKIVLDISFMIHKDLGPGLLESVYEEILFYELRNRNLFVERQKAIPAIWKNEKLNLGFRADLIVSKKVLIEIKSIEGLAPVHFKQVLTYLKLTEIKLGLLINFNEALLKTGIRRIVNGL